MERLNKKEGGIDLQILTFESWNAPAEAPTALSPAVTLIKEVVLSSNQQMRNQGYTKTS